MNRYLWAALILLLLSAACKKPGQTPEDSFTSFSMAATMAQPAGLDKFGETEYSRNFQNMYDNLGILQAIWPRNIVVVKKTQDGDVVTLDVQGTAGNGRTLNGQFKLRQSNGMWRIFEGDWVHRPEETPEVSAGEGQP